PPGIRGPGTGGMTQSGQDGEHERATHGVRPAQRTRDHGERRHEQEDDGGDDGRGPDHGVVLPSSGPSGPVGLSVVSGVPGSRARAMFARASRAASTSSSVTGRAENRARWYRPRKVAMSDGGAGVAASTVA